MNQSQPYTMSIEPIDAPAYQHGYHLGTDEALARALCVEKYLARNSWGLHTRTVALMRYGKIVDCFDGQWASERANQLFAIEE